LRSRCALALRTGDDPLGVDAGLRFIVIGAFKLCEPAGGRLNAAAGRA
jgi:hypothetical protein